MMKHFFIGLLIISFLVGTIGCAEWNRTAKGAAIGAASGALIGAIAGGDRKATAIGAGIGGIGSAISGYGSTKQWWSS